MSDSSSRLNTLDLLRAFAAIMVCFFHLRWSNNDWIKEFFDFGYLGVDIFFCISGFITPLALTWGKFSYTKLPTYLFSRFLRLYPAFAVIALFEIYLYYYGSSIMGYGSHPDRITWERTLANFTLTADFQQIDWYVPVFWTLAIEAQFYLGLLLCFPLLQSKNVYIPILVTAAWAISPLVMDSLGLPPKGPTLGSYGPLFAMGMAAFLVYSKKIPHLVFLALVALATYTESQHISSYAAYTAAGTALAIIYLPPFQNRFIEFFSKISYSFFLIHITFGGAVMCYFKSFPQTWHYQLPAVLLATSISTIVSYRYHKWVELPLHNFSRKLRKQKQ